MKRVLLTLLIAVTAVSVQAYPKAKMTVVVRDQEGNPVVNARAKAYYYEASSKHDEFITDTNGQFVVEHHCMGSMGGSLEKEGFYGNGYGYRWKFDNVKGFMLKRFEPWNPTVNVVMKKISNPVPMIMKYTDWIKVPEYDKPIGYDLEVGDWVAPYGKGTHGDFVFTFTGFYKDRLNASLRCDMSFSNEKDGIQVYEQDATDKSQFIWPFEAPEDGYESNMMRFDSFLTEEGYKTNVNDKQQLIFRVRTKLDESGNVVSANYGKIDGDIRVSRGGKINFRYWFNQHGTRNLEDDPGRNQELIRDWRKKQ